MTNDEARNANRIGSGSAPILIRTSSFGHSFRHSAFVIRHCLKMPKDASASLGKADRRPKPESQKYVP